MDLVGDEMSDTVVHFLNHGGMPDCVNDTTMVLIPKIKKPREMKDLRPICLCNISYKLISKVLANRLKVFLPDIIEDNQSAFVQGRLITDNILLALEVFHFMKTSAVHKRGFMALKLDMSKAYDRIEWDYLRGIMMKMSSPVSRIHRVMECVSPVSHSFLVNGQHSNSMIPRRGLRQGDPLSLYVFLLCAEGLAPRSKQAYLSKMLRGISIARGAPIISHLFFTNDSIIFSNATLREASTIKNILRHYEEAPRQKVNVEKSEISFSSKFEVQSRNIIKNC